jgi:hypothetical protein
MSNVIAMREKKPNSLPKFYWIKIEAGKVSKKLEINSFSDSLIQVFNPALIHDYIILNDSES